METFLAVLAVVGFSSCAVVLLVRRVVGAARHRMTQVRERARLTARTYAVGPTGDVARLRRDMDRSLAAARRALATARGVQAPVGDVPSLLGRLELACCAVDGELRILAAKPDRAGVAAALAGPRSRAQAVMSSAASLVDGLLDAAGHDADNLSLLQAECAIEADALRATAHGLYPGWSRTLR